MPTCGSKDETVKPCRWFRYIPNIGFWCIKHDIPAYKEGWCSDHQPLDNYVQGISKLEDNIKLW